MYIYNTWKSKVVKATREYYTRAKAFLYCNTKYIL